MHRMDFTKRVFGAIIGRTAGALHQLAISLDGNLVQMSEYTEGQVEAS